MSFTIDENGLLSGNGVEHRLTNKHSGYFESYLPDSIVMHYTGGSSLEGAVTHLLKPTVKASAHLVLGRDGKVVQLVPFSKKAWHAGKSRYKNRVGFNQYSIGIEMVNAGPMNEVGEQYISTFGKKYHKDEILKAVHRNENQPRYWQIYTEQQIECAHSICSELINHFGIKMLFGHEEISPGRKIDPGPAFPLDLFREQLLTARSENEDSENIDKHCPEEVESAFVTASNLNIRETPSLYGNLVREPLKYGQSLEVIKEQSGWYKVKVVETGWVKKDYIDYR